MPAKANSGYSSAKRMSSRSAFLRCRDARNAAGFFGGLGRISLVRRKTEGAAVRAVELAPVHEAPRRMRLE